MAWYLRGSPGKPDCSPQYVDPKLFSIRICYGGDLSSKSYSGGDIAWFDFCDKDQMSILEINLMVRELGYNKDPHHIQPIKYWYKVSGEEICGGLTQLQVDRDVVDMVALVPRVARVFDIYLEHVNPSDFLESQATQVQSSLAMYDDDDELMEVTLLELAARTKKKTDGALGSKKSEAPQASKDKDTTIFETKDKGKAIMGEEVISKAVVTYVPFMQREVREYPGGYFDSEEDDEDDDRDLSYAESDYGGDEGDDTDWIGKFVDESEEWAGFESAEEEETNEVFSFDVEEEDRIEDVLQSASDSDTETRKNKQLEFNSSTDMGMVHFELGMIFTDCKEFRQAVRNYCIQNGKEVHYHRNEKYKLSVKCKREGCPWELYAGRHENDCLLVKTCGPEHTCGRIFDNKMVTSSWLAKTYVDKIKSNPEWPIQSMKDQFQDDYNSGASNMKFFRAKKAAFKLIEGSHKEQYAMLWDYAEEIKRTNPESTVKIKAVLVDDQPKFERMYICLAACKKGFKAGCRALIGLDGCHLKGPYGGQLLTAVGIDANNQCWVIAYAVVEVENKSSWVWFLEYLTEDLEIKDQYKYTFISDKQKGLIQAFELVVPNSHLRFCVRHLLSNFKLTFKGKVLKDKLWECARATTVQEFGRRMQEMKALSKEAFDWLAHKPPSQWSKSHFNTIPICDMLLNNICESFNAQLLPARCKPILTSMEAIRTLLMKRIQVRRDQMRKYQGKICPKPQKVLEINKVLAGKWATAWNGADSFQVSCKSEQIVVDLHEHTCSCRKWDLTGIPCEHAIASINYVGGSKNPEDYVHSKYSKETFLSSYENLINPLNGPLLWEPTGQTPLIPPTYFRPPGRPKKLRRKEPSELENTNKLPRSGGTFACSICRRKGHNARTHHKHLDSRPKAGGKSKLVPATSKPSTSPKKIAKKKKTVDSSSTPSTSGPSIGSKRRRSVSMSQHVLESPSTSAPSKSAKKRVAKKKSLAVIVSSAPSTSGAQEKLTGAKSDGPKASTSQAGPKGDSWSCQ